MNKNAKILIVGHNDIIEKSLLHYFQSNGYKNISASSLIAPDVLNQSAISRFFENEQPDYVFLASTRSGGIAANQKYAAEFIYSNLESQNNIIHASYKFGVKKLLFFAGSCVYPKECPQPMKEEHLLAGPLEVTSEAYSIAKIAGIKLCQTYKKQYGFNAIAAIPATVYGPGSDMEPETAHVLGALIAKFAAAVSRDDKEVVVWGTGRARREFLFVNDFVDACLFLMKHYHSSQMINVGCGYDVSIKELAETIQKASGFKGKIVFDTSKPDGVKRKLLDSRRLFKLGWRPKTSLKEGIKETYAWYTQAFNK